MKPLSYRSMGREFLALRHNTVVTARDEATARELAKAILAAPTATSVLASLDPEGREDALVRAILAGEIQFAPISTPAPLMAPPVTTNLADINPVEPELPVEPPPQEPVSEHFLDFIVVGQGHAPALKGKGEVVSDLGRDVGSSTVGEETVVRWLTPTSEQEFRLSLGSLRWWAGAASVHEEPKDATLAEFEDTLFNFNSVVLLPTTGAEPGAAQPSGRMTGLAAIKAVIEHAQETGGQILAVGHTDTTGSDAGNEKLALQRANSVLWVLKGHGDDWAAAASARSYKVDWKAILAWVHASFGWDCAPGVLDESDDPTSVGARQRFRERYQAEYGVSIPTGDQNGHDWKAYFVLYEKALAKLLGVDATGLEDIRAALNFTAPEALGCGERWPKDAPGQDDYASALNRRVDIWIFADEVPDLDEQPLGAALYGENSKLAPHYLAVTSDEGAAAFELSVVDAQMQPRVGVEVQLFQGGNMFAALVTDSAGRVWVEPPATGPVELEVEGQELAVGYGGCDEAGLLTPDGEPDPDALEGFVC